MEHECWDCGWTGDESAVEDSLCPECGSDNVGSVEHENECECGWSGDEPDTVYICPNCGDELREAEFAYYCLACEWTGPDRDAVEKECCPECGEEL